MFRKRGKYTAAVRPRKPCQRLGVTSIAPASGDRSSFARETCGEISKSSNLIVPTVRRESTEIEPVLLVRKGITESGGSLSLSLSLSSEMLEWGDRDPQACGVY